MKLRRLLITSILVMGLTAPVMADTYTRHDLAAPVINLIPSFQDVRDELNLSSEQVDTIERWVTEAPKTRKKLEREALALRAELREALLTRAPRLEREALKQALANKETRLIEMSSLCARMLHSTLTEAQYGKVLNKYRTSEEKMAKLAQR